MASEVEVRAEHARQLLENPVFKQAFYPLQVAIMDEIKATDVTDADRRNMLGLKLQMLGEFEDQILAAIEDQQIEQRPAEFDSPVGLM